MVMDRGSCHLCIILYYVNLFPLVVNSPKQAYKASSALLCVFPVFNHHSANCRAVEDFAVCTERVGAGQCSPGVLSTDWKQCPIAPWGTEWWWWKLNWEWEDWDGEFLSSVQTSWASEAAPQQGMRPSMRQGCEGDSTRRAELVQDGFRQIWTVDLSRCQRPAPCLDT